MPMTPGENGSLRRSNDCLEYSGSYIRGQIILFLKILRNWDLIPSSKTDTGDERASGETRPVSDIRTVRGKQLMKMLS